jgi:hypothetical protein
MNLSGSGVSWTLGPRGASIGVGKRGTFLNTGIPGTGIYNRQQLSPSSSIDRNTLTQANTQKVSITVSINEDGVLSFQDEQGNSISEVNIDAAKKQQGQKIKALIQEKCDEINSQIEALGEIHLHTAEPKSSRYVLAKYEESAPIEPKPRRPSFFCKFFKSCVAKIENLNRSRLDKYTNELNQWENRKVEFDKSELEHQKFIDRVINGDIQAIETFVEESLKGIVWPRETLVEFEVGNEGDVTIDVDLPEIEDMPTKTAMAPQRGYRLSIKEMGVTNVQKLYMKHVHAVGFRIIGEIFAASPAIMTVVLSAYSQRPNKATGQVGNEYLYSIKVNREKWIEIDFNNLNKIDLVEAFNRFELRRDMTKTGIFKAVEPF